MMASVEVEVNVITIVKSKCNNYANVQKTKLQLKIMMGDSLHICQVGRLNV